MELERYDIEESSDELTYRFYSDGPKGRIRKAVSFQPARHLGRNAYNLLFGDYVESTGWIDDRVVSNNGDPRIILLVVAGIVDKFVNLYPQAIIFIKGSSASRTRLYQMGITSAWSEIREKYDIWGAR
ncbi:MAG TPA: hypothetical protein VGM89_18870, partial [Puia sp.]